MTDLLFDAPSLFARCWFACRSTPDLALQAFVQSILLLLDRQDSPLGASTSRTLFAWEGKAKTDKPRDAKAQEYYVTRDQARSLATTLFGAAHGCHPDFEADDIVATAAYNATADQVFVISGDKDLMQLANHTPECNISYYCLNTKSVMSPRAICQKFNVKRPLQIALAMAIIGDRVDGVPGIPKWGPKTSARLFERVLPDMTFNEALNMIKAQIPYHLHACFLESLDKTLLHVDVPDVPAPAPLAFCDLDLLDGQNLPLEITPGIRSNYTWVARQYESQAF